MHYLTKNLQFLIMTSVCFGIFEGKSSKSNRFAFKVTEDGKERLIEGLKQYNFTKLFQITPSTLVFEYAGNGKPSAVFYEMKYMFRKLIVECEPVRVYNDTLKPEDGYTNSSEDLTSSSNYVYNPNLVCSNYYGFNVSEVWSMGITGKGVVVGINDVGINTDLADLERNIMKNLSMNFLTDSDNVTPDEFKRYREKAVHFTDHGNNVASIVAATKANNVCSAGIAYNASIVALKIFNVTFKKYDLDLYQLQPEHWTSSNIIAMSLAYALDQIDIFVNAWAATELFDPLDLSTREALQYGVNSGRHGRGTVYVVPAGPAGNELSNNINTITVGGMGRYGTIPDSPRIDPSVITVGLNEGNNLTAKYMVTTSHRNNCVTSFKGVSAATAQVAGIIALALSANPNLTKRDVEHLLVHASDHTGFKETPFFVQNGAGIYFHPIFGFGLLNAYELVKLAQEHKIIPRQLSKQVLRTNSSTHRDIQTFVFCYSCDISSDVDCLTTVEHAEITINFTTETKYLRMELISPYQTHSVLMHQHLTTGEIRKLSAFKQAKFVSVHFWEETPFGKWKIQLQSNRDTSETHVSSISLTLYGTKNTDRTFNDFGDCPNDMSVHAVTVDELSLQETQTHDDTNLHPAVYVAIIVPTAVFVIAMLLFVLKYGDVHDIPLHDHRSPSKTPLICSDLQNNETRFNRVSEPDSNSLKSVSEGGIEF